MWIKDLPHETIEKLCCALERAPTMDWQMLMRRKPLCNFFPPDPDDFEDLINLIASSASPAKAFLDDLTCREITIQDLVNGLRHIGNKKAISIIERGKKKNCDIPDFGGRPRPPPIIRQPEEHTMSRLSCTPSLQRREQSETLRFPIQESDTDAGYPSDPVLEIGMGMVSGLFSCLRLFRAM